MLSSLTLALVRQLEYLKKFDDVLPDDRVQSVRSSAEQSWDKNLRRWVTLDLPVGVVELHTANGRRFIIMVEEVDSDNEN